MDGSSFTIGQQAQGPPALAASALEAATPDEPRRSQELRFDRAHWTSVACAALAHLAVVLILLAVDDEAMGSEGVALETIAVSMVSAVPSISAPETRPADATELRADTDEPAAEAASQSTSDQERQPTEPIAPPLTLDLPPEPFPLPDAPTLPARFTERPPEPERPARERIEEPAEARAEPTPPRTASAPVVTGALPQQSSAEAATGVVRAYARQISGVLDRNKPRARGMAGEVKVQFVVGLDGKPLLPRLLNSSGNAKLDEIVLLAIGKMDFPAPPREMNLSQRTFNVPFAYRPAR